MHVFSFLFFCLLHVLCANGLSFSFETHNKSPCGYKDAYSQLIFDSDVQFQATKNWVGTHEVNSWEFSNVTVVDNPASYPEIKRFNIPVLPPDSPFVCKHFNLVYDSVVKLPDILKPLMKTIIHTKTKKSIFVIGDREFKITTVHNVPIVNVLTIYSRTFFDHTGNLISNNDVIGLELPWFAAWSIKTVKKSIIDSVNDFHKKFLSTLCQQ